MLYERIDSKLGWQYPRALMTELQGKMTVSELKKMAGEEMTGELLYPEKPSELLPDMGNPLYMAQQKGTATHKIFELLPFSEIASKEDVISFIHCCVEKEQIPAFWEELIPADKVFDFCRSELGQRMIRAEKAGRLYRERPFVMGIPISDVYPELLTASPAEKEEQILIQGVIDVFFEEDDGIVLLDYKTDRIPKGTAGDELLIKRYKTRWTIIRKQLSRLREKSQRQNSIFCYNEQRNPLLMNRFAFSWS